jgi:Cu(I)/Ag(I) efflux system membrane fusion protein
MKSSITVMLLITGLAVFASGCGSTTDEPTGAEAGAEQSPAGDSIPDEAKAELAKLSPEDAEAAEQQRVCPVSGEVLGGMGVPKKVDVNGQAVWICCDACRDPLLESPDEYLAKLEQQ